LGHRTNRSIARIDRNDRRRRIRRIGKCPLDRGESQSLQARIDGRVDLEAAGADRVRSVLALERLANVAEEIGLADTRVQTASLQVELALSDRVGVLARRDVSVPEHRAKHLVPAGDRLRRALERVEDGRRLRQAGQQRRLRQGELARRLGEVRLGGCLDPVRVVPVVDPVHVGVEDPGLRFPAGQLDREARLGRLAPERLRLLRDVEIADELLGDRRPALHDSPSLDVRVERAYDAQPVKCAVLVETSVLDRDRCGRSPLADLSEPYRLAVLLRGDRSQQRPVGGEDERILPDVHRLEGIEVAAVHPDGSAREARHDQEDRRADERSRHEPAEPLSPVPHALPPPLPQAVEQEGVRLRTPSALRRRHAYTPAARSTSWACRRSSRSRCSAEERFGAGTRTTTVASADRSFTNTSPSAASVLSRSTTAPRSLPNGTWRLISATFSRLRIVELRMVSEASFSFGITSRSPLSVRTN